MKFLELISDIFNVFGKAHTIRNSENRQKSVRFAVSSIVYSILMVVFAFGGAFLLTISGDSLLFLFVLVIAIALLVGAVVQFIGALVRVIAQFTINRSAMSWIALAVFLIAVAIPAVTILIYVL